MTKELLNDIERIEKISSVIMLEECTIIQNSIKLNINNIIENRKGDEEIKYTCFPVIDNEKEKKIKLIKICL